MPIFEFRCVACGEVFEKLFMSSDDKADMSCPHCHSDIIERVVSKTNYVMGAGVRRKTAEDNDNVLWTV
jgi:putative FmdB family regulatory protein